MNRPEQDLQIAVMDHVRARKAPRTVVFHVPNAGKRSHYVGKKMKEAGLVSGIPDLICIREGQSYGLELKAGKGKKYEPTADQIAAMESMELAGAQTAVAHSLDEALVTLEFWGILRRNANRGTAA
jgi:hypothetical protein